MIRPGRSFFALLLRLRLAAVLVVASYLGACSGGSGSATGIAGCADGSQALCVTRCNLGCGNRRCGSTNIAVNQRLDFAFNFEIDAATVNTNTFRLRDEQGNEPIGVFLVQREVVSFIPKIEVIGETTFFGFTRDATYTLDLPGGKDAYQTLRSTSGDALGESFTCSLVVSQGVVDFDARAPRASVLVPATSGCVTADSSFLLEFSELVDPQTLQEGVGGVDFLLSRISSSGSCLPESIPLPGVRSTSVDVITQRTRLVFRPSLELPHGTCISVVVSDDVRDLASKRAEAAVFRFMVCEGSGEQRELVEDFATQERQDPLRGGGQWGQGKLVPAVLGGSGQLGDFEYAKIATQVDERDAAGRVVYVIDTSRVVVPPGLTVSGNTEVVTNGVLDFTSFRVPSGVRLRFVGSHVPVLRVSGSVEVHGVLEVPPEAATVLQGANRLPPTEGQAGFRGGIGAGSGGRGGDSPLHVGASRFDGSDGGDLVIASGHPLRDQASGTGGRASSAYPASGATKDVVYTGFSGQISQMCAAGGGGGGFLSPGEAGSCVRNDNRFGNSEPRPSDYGPAPLASSHIDFASLVGLQGTSSELYRIGGAGGGGSGTHTSTQYKPIGSQPQHWSPGSGGAGGGGVLQLRVGRDFYVATGAEVQVRGGDAQDYIVDALNLSNPAPGGAGSGGSLLVQLAGLVDLRGSLDASGGKGGRFRSAAYWISVDSLSGAGGDGFVRIEADPPPSLAQLTTLRPTVRAGNVGRLLERDRFAVVMTRYYDTGLLFPPRFLHYVIEARVQGQPVSFSDDQGLGRLAARGEAIEVFFQGAKLDPQTRQLEERSETQWFEHRIAPIGQAARSAFRVLLRFDRAVAEDIVVTRMRFVYET